MLFGAQESYFLYIFGLITARILRKAEKTCWIHLPYMEKNVTLCSVIRKNVAKSKIENKGSVNIKNKKAEFDYILMDKYTAGIVLTGTEIKSIRKGKASLVDTYCMVLFGEVWVKNMYIAQYEQGSYNNHVERRDRKLLLNRKEIRKIQNTVKAPGFSIVPVLLFIDENGRAKLDIHIARGKKEYDKRETLKEKEDRKNISRQFKKII